MTAQAESSKRVLVLGGSGFVGRGVCEQLVAAGHRVTVPTRRRANARSIQHLPLLDVVEADVHDSAALAQWVAGHDAVINLVAVLHGDVQRFEHVHVALPKAVAEACQAANVQRLVHVSALGVGDAAPSMYLRSKWRGEQALQSAGLAELAIVRPSVVFGAGDKLLTLFAKLQGLAPFVPLAGADARFQPVWVVDLAKLLAKMAVCPGFHLLECYKNQSNVVEAAGPEVLRLRDLVALSGRYAGCEKPIFALPDAVAKLQAQLMEWAPGEPLMSQDNLASMAVPNVATGKHAGLEAFGIAPQSIHSIAPTYLGRSGPRSKLDVYRRLGR